MTPPHPPPAEVAVDAALVRALLVEQHPDLAPEPLREVLGGWDNAMVRIGDHLAARLPRRASAVALLEREARYLPTLARDLPIRVPAPLRHGVPSAAYPWPWLVVSWISGEAMADSVPFTATEERAAAIRLGAFLRALHREAPGDVARNPWRGMPFAERLPITDAHLAQLGSELGGVEREVRAVLDAALAAPAHDGAPRWLHGDLHPRNVIVDAGRIEAIIDFGDCTPGDPATDLAAAWLLFSDAGARQALRRSSGADDAAWCRAQGWAVAHALAHLAGGGAVEVHRRIGFRALERVLRDQRPPTSHQSSSR